MTSILHIKSNTVLKDIISLGYIDDMKLLITVTLLALVKLSTQADYCNPALCATGKKHVACNGLTSFAAACGAQASMLTMDATFKTLIVDMHNQLRSKIATGKQEYAPGKFYPQAARMATMIWDDELASLAAYNARSCKFAHDQCRNTVDCPAAGQNIAIQNYYGQTITDTDHIVGFINAWYIENSDANPSLIASYPSNWSGPMIGHFTQIVADRATRVGCAMVTYVTAPWINKYFVCNYALTNIVSQPVYVAGNACSKCTKGCSSKYPGLCVESEPIVPKP